MIDGSDIIARINVILEEVPAEERASVLATGALVHLWRLGATHDDMREALDFCLNSSTRGS